jgi:hypothetical protein
MILTIEREWVEGATETRIEAVEGTGQTGQLGEIEEIEWLQDVESTWEVKTCRWEE